MMWKLDSLEHQSRAEGSSEPGLALGDNIQPSLNAEASPSGINTEMKKTGQVFAQPQTWSWAATDQNQQGDVKEEERAQQPVRREMSWAGPEPGAEHWNSNSLGQRRERPVCLLSESELPLEEESGGAGSAPDWERSEEEWRVVKVKPVMITSATPQAKETNLSRSASFSEKELKEARDRSQIIAAQLTTPPNANSRGVQLFNRRKQRVNAFTLVSFGKGAGQGPLDKDSKTCEGTFTDKQNPDPSGSCTPKSLKCRSVSPRHRDTGDKIMEEQVESIHEADTDDSSLEIPEVQVRKGLAEELRSEAVAVASTQELKEEPPSEVFNYDKKDQPTHGLLEAEENGPSYLVITGKVQNKISSAEKSGEISVSLSKQPPTIVNRTARPFGSPALVSVRETRSPVSPPPAFSTPPKPALPAPQTPSFPNPPPVSRVISPSPAPYVPLYAASTDQRPAYEPRCSNEERQHVPVQKSGILEEGKTRRASRKSMFTFQEKPKVNPNPELLSLVQGVDEKKKHKQPGGQTQDEELLALGAEASNFLTKANSEDSKAPEWSSCLKSSGSRVMSEPKPAQGLTNVAGKGAELFAKRQTRMEKYVVESPPVIRGSLRSPSPTMSLPPSWTFASNVPGRVRAMADSANITANPSRNAKQQSSGSFADQESPVMENGSSKKEMAIAKHQPYQMNSSLFILSPSKDPVRSLPRAAPPPKPTVLDRAYTRQSSLPFSPPPVSPLFDSPTPFRATKCLSSQVPPSPVNGLGTQFRPSLGAPLEVAEAPPASPASSLQLGRVSSPRPGIQAPRPTFCAKKAGIEPQAWKESLSVTSTWTPRQSRPPSSPDRGTGVSKAQPAAEVPVSSPQARYPSSGSSPLSPPWDQRSQSSIGQDIKASRRMLAKNIINAARRKNTTSPGGRDGRGASTSPTSVSFLHHGQQPPSPLSFQARTLVNQSPTFWSPPETPTRMIRSPVRLYATRSLTDSDASGDSEDSGLRSPSSGLKSPGARSYNTCPRGWNGGVRLKRDGISAEL
ncbi:synaptopodin-like isoform X1 [Acipenser ruthenus]|uniref:synaptopodin-like isoform X1 n=1 Tax=Acipenser ruthenus TaxID=7906 RepID=UPI002740A256|nr:synaptopodin-like isoform X1 [Acipenser ruthenus]XP_058853068.1 synaptopodin-like isoform X1 [Acipenser ruthenus]XP_058853069.1 synaptopodin-like isoform X1 [Acipenser ruthenus]XP_058853070.1 synaptopodin-like isoform X1 [Acipenser ruthenus]XP_058853071.1 synaptopodin-like isoform X1 [Acipenser ruthenus]XP_058853072.1 synaptopodin-like isoform X1 [Acipenser ruthenus]XP_058853073.1 synaptopodin-like isoform X1 [Acipenser ruthenus]XP_058853074.1 synaptopodin-like isoform X1 [Acipenser ruthe